MLITISLTCRADYSPLTLFEMAIKADKIVYGTIDQLESDTFKLSIEGSLTGDGGSLTIHRFEDWPCASRWTDYRVGQKVFLFLQSFDGGLHIMSAGGEGEFPIKDTSVYLHGFTIPPAPPPPPKGTTPVQELIYFDVKLHNVYNGEYFGYKMDFNQFVDNVKKIRDCFIFEYGKYYSITKFTSKCPVDKMKSQSDNNKLIAWVVDEMKRNEREVTTE